MQVILNIGLDGITPSESYTNGQANPPAVARSLQAVQTARQLGFKFLHTRLLESDTEPTLVARVEVARPNHDVAILAQHLNQDCIAVYDEFTGRGALCGPRAHKWGDFNPEFFFTLNGQRLAEKAKAA